MMQSDGAQSDGRRKLLISRADRGGVPLIPDQPDSDGTALRRARVQARKSYAGARGQEIYAGTRGKVTRVRAPGGGCPGFRAPTGSRGPASVVFPSFRKFSRNKGFRARGRGGRQ